MGFSIFLLHVLLFNNNKNHTSSFKGPDEYHLLIYSYLLSLAFTSGWKVTTMAITFIKK